MFVLTLAGCLFLTDAQLERALDGDGDGHDAHDVGGDDCDDADPGVTNGETRWVDADGDGYGDPDTAFSSCDATGVDNGDDCDDTDAAVGLGDPWYGDADGDGWGADTPIYELCGDAGAGYARVGGDCNDAEADVNPGVLESAYDDMDYDCDGQTRDGILEVVGMALGPTAGGTDAGVAAVALSDADGLDDVAVGLPGRGVGGGVFLIEGVADWGDPLALHFIDTATAGASWTATDGDARGGSALAAADLDGDGATDLVIGAPGASSVAVVYGPHGAGELNGDTTISAAEGALGAALATGNVSFDGGEPVPGLLVAGSDPAYLLLGPTLPSGEADAAVLGAATVHVAADAVPALGDLDGDGMDEAVFAVPAGAGDVWVCAGTELSGELYAELCGGLHGAAEGDTLGAAVVVADLDDDGVVDLVAGAPGADGPGADPDVGAVYVVLGGGPIELDAADADRVIVGEPGTTGDGGHAGAALAAPGPLTPGGPPTLAVGAPYWNDPRNGSHAGAVYWLLDPIGAGVDTLADADERSSGTWGSPAPGNTGCEAGSGLWPGLDFDGDDVTDTLVGAPGWLFDGSEANGAVVVVSGRWIE